MHHPHYQQLHQGAQVAAYITHSGHPMQMGPPLPMDALGQQPQLGSQVAGGNMTMDKWAPIVVADQPPFPFEQLQVPLPPQSQGATTAGATATISATDSAAPDTNGAPTTAIPTMPLGTAIGDAASEFSSLSPADKAGVASDSTAKDATTPDV